MERLYILLSNLRRDERAQDMIEYALLAGFIAVAAGALQDFPGARPRKSCSHSLALIRSTVPASSTLDPRYLSCGTAVTLLIKKNLFPQ